MESVQRRCYGCGLVKAIEDFPTNKTEKHGHAYQCRACRAEERRQKAHLRDPAKHREWKNQYTERNREHVRELERRQYAERKAAGLCTKCGKQAALPNRVRCLECGMKKAGRSPETIYGSPQPRSRKEFHGIKQVRKARFSVPRFVRAERPACVLCGFEYTDIHHIDYDHRNSDLSNLVALCPNHHRMVHLNLLCIIPRHE